MVTTLIFIGIFIFSTLVGYKVISDVPSLLHTPLMSGMNALSGVTVVGAVVAASASIILASKILGALAVFFATINVVGGFAVTGRMLKMFKSDR